jgi:hypothetical protein
MEKQPTTTGAPPTCVSANKEGIKMDGRLTRAEVREQVIQELDEMFVRLADRWRLPSGDVAPLVQLEWEERTVPAAVDYCWSLYDGNAPD